MKQTITKNKSLDEVHSSISIPKTLSKLRKFLAFVGPGYLVSVGYMDPGNWATDIAGGSQFGYRLLIVVILSNLMAMVLQHLSLKLGIATGRDLAQACRDKFGKRTTIFLWLFAEVAIIACDLAEVIGSAIALELLFGLPILLGVLLTSFDTLILLLIQKRGQRSLEFLITSLVALIFGSFALELFWSHPSLVTMFEHIKLSKEIFSNQEMLYISIGILGATVMPHNLYLHSAIVQTRNFSRTIKGKAEAIFYSTWDSTLALLAASGVNAAILIMSAAVFYTNGIHEIAEIQDAHKLLAPILGNTFAPVVFAFALLASGHSSTITGTLAGQIVMEGFIDIKLKPWQRRLVTRLIAIIPAIAVILIYGENGLGQLLVFSQVVLSLQLPFAVIPLVWFTSSKKIMKSFANSKKLAWISGTIATVITVFNLILIGQVFNLI